MKPVTPAAQKHGFTLVELLIVIGIIAMLIAILLPTLAKARQSATTIKCASNMRQIGNVMTMFADTNGRRLPGQCLKWSGSFWGSVANWQDILNILYFNKGAGSQIPQYQSQNASASLGCTALSAYPTASPRVYIMNIYASGGRGVNDTSTPALAKLDFGILRDPSILNSAYVQSPPVPTTGTYEYYLGAKLSMFANASEKILITETEALTDTVYPPNAASAYLGDYSVTPVYSAGRGAFSFRHSSFTTMNVLFVDMHVEGMQCDRGSKKIDSRLTGTNSVTNFQPNTNRLYPGPL